MLLEIACFNLESCRIAQEAGADRVELCQNYEAGGLTPSSEIITQARSFLKITLHVIIRPRDGDFFYSPAEIEEMKKSILFCKEKRIDGVVFGILNKDRTVNKEICLELVNIAHPMACTFHRAFDQCVDLKKEIKTLIDCGFEKVLSSGGEKNAMKGGPRLKELIQTFGNKIIIMPGAGIRSSNISEIINVTEAKEFHSAALVNGNIADAGEIKSMKQKISA